MWIVKDDCMINSSQVTKISVNGNYLYFIRESVIVSQWMFDTTSIAQTAYTKIKEGIKLNHQLVDLSNL